MFARLSSDELKIVQKFCSEAPVKIGLMASSLGLKVYEDSLSLNISGLIRPSKESASGFEVVVNRYDSIERKRFTVAHEVSHFLLHRNFIENGVTDSALYRSVLSSRLEVEANRMAAELLMPTDLVRAELLRLKWNAPDIDSILGAMANTFRVSKAAMSIRLEGVYDRGRVC